MQYDVCLSFAGEDRVYVQEVAESLRSRAVKVFYDKYEQVELWGKDLYSHLDAVYRVYARYCVLFISSSYASKVWTNHERRSAQARALSANSDYILPVRFDDTEVPGLPPTIGHIDLRTVPPTKLADLICEKLEASFQVTDSPPSIKWFDHASYTIRSESAALQAFQGTWISHDDEPLRHVLSDLIGRLQKSAVLDGDGLYFSDGQDRRFDRLYSSASALTALRQLNIHATHPLLTKLGSYLKKSDPGDLDDRAATVCLMHTGLLDEAECKSFVAMLAANQVTDADSTNYGSFLLPQGPSTKLGPRDNWNSAVFHSDGASFHACHVADVLLHIPDRFTAAQDLAAPMLGGIRRYLLRSFDINHGWLTSLTGENSPITMFAYAISPRLSVPLPRDWRIVVQAIMDMLESARFSVLTRCFGVMNLCYLWYTVGDEQIYEQMVPFIERFLTRLPERTALEEMSVTTVCSLLRAIAYATNATAPGVYAQLSRVATETVDDCFSSGDFW